MKSADQLMLSIGAVLASEREKRGIPVEKAAKETRMRPQRIRDMENDDLSHFTNPSYARMFIIAYAKYLGVSMQTIMDHLPDRGESGSEDYHYLTAPTAELPSLRRDLISRPLRRHAWLPTVALITGVILVLVALAGTIYLGMNMRRFMPSADKPVAGKTEAPDDADAPAVVETKTVYVLETPHLDNLPAPSPTPVDPIATSPAPPPSTTAPSTFTEAASIAAPPKPTPIVVIGEQPAPATNLQSSAPAASPVDEADRAFLLGSSPDQKVPAR